MLVEQCDCKQIGTNQRYCNGKDNMFHLSLLIPLPTILVVLGSMSALILEDLLLTRARYDHPRSHIAAHRRACLFVWLLHDLCTGCTIRLWNCERW